MSVFIGSDGYGRFQIGWCDDTEAKIWASLGSESVRVLRGQIRKMLNERDVEDDLRAARRDIEELKRRNAALRGALSRKRGDK